MPFEVPESWEWCKLIDVCHIFGRIGFRGYTKDDLVANDGAITLSPSNIIEGQMNYDNCTYISWDKYEESPEIQIANGDILLVKTGSSFGKCAYVCNLPQEATINPQFVVLKYILCNPRFLTYILQSGYARRNYDEFVLGTAIPTFTQVVLGDMYIPLPSIQEQQRIVNAIEQWSALIDTLETAKEELHTSIEHTKSKILDLAIHGKLVPQDPNDEPAIELLKRINPKFTPCDNAHCPYDIPENWYWCKLIDLCSFLSRGKSPTYSEERKYPVFAQKCNLYGGGISLDQARFLDPNTLSKWPEDYKLLDGDVLVNSTGTGTVGRTRLFHSDCLGSYPFVVPDSHVSVIRTVGNIDSDYIYSIVSSRYGQEYIEDNLAGSTNQKELYIGVLENMLIPLPPYDEQRRIASKLKESFAVLEAIQDSIEA